MTHYRTIWLSDIHLGSKGCQAENLLYFLKHTESDYLILVGDIIDFWAMSRKLYWPTSHNTIIQKILKKARHGTKVIFVHGNHDNVLHDYIGLKFGDVEIQKEYLHTLSNGETFWCIHGDDFDLITRYHSWVALLGDVGYEWLLKLNRYFNVIRKLLDLPYWSLSAFIKHRVKDAVNFISDYEQSIITEAIKRKVSGVVCGHIHKAELTKMNDVWYVNTGDNVESCTAITETQSGDLQLLCYLEQDIKILKECNL